MTLKGLYETLAHAVTILREDWLMMIGRHSSARGGGKRGGGPPISVGQPGSSSAIGYDPATDTLVKEDTLQSTNETSTNYGASLQWHKLQYPLSGSVPNLSALTVAVDTSASTDATYPHGIKVTMPDPAAALTAGSWTTGTGDFQGGMEGGMFMNPATAMSSATIGGAPGYEFWFSYRRKFDVGFRWSAFYPSTLTPNTTRARIYKEWLTYRQPFGGPQGRLTVVAIEDNNLAQNGSTQSGDVSGPPAMNWRIDFESDASSTHPGVAYYISDRNNYLRGTDKSPPALADGAEHELVYHFRNETVSGLGDGLVELYVDDLPVIQCDGADPASAVSGLVWTRLRQWMSSQWNPTINGGSAQSQNHWLLGPVRAWTRP